jgi:hypothetical protein
MPTIAKSKIGQTLLNNVFFNEESVVVFLKIKCFLFRSKRLIKIKVYIKIPMTTPIIVEKEIKCEFKTKNSRESVVIAISPTKPKKPGTRYITETKTPIIKSKTTKAISVAKNGGLIVPNKPGAKLELLVQS